jgi:hypothetical protein
VSGTRLTPSCCQRQMLQNLQQTIFI